MSYFKVNGFGAGIIVLLSACSGGNDATSDALSISDMQGLDATDTLALPTSGRASYRGFLALQLPSAPEPGSDRAAYTGSLALSVDFGLASGQLSGTAEDFRGPSDAELLGRLFVTDGSIDVAADVATDYTFEAGLSGTLDGDGLRNSVVTGTMTGDFIGGDATLVSGVVYGSVTTVLGVDVFDGSFAATQD